MCKSVGKADLLSDHFDGKQSRESVDLPLTYHPSPSLTSFTFRSSEVRRLLLDLDSYGGSDPLGMFPLFLKRTADVLSPRLTWILTWILGVASKQLRLLHGRVGDSTIVVHSLSPQMSELVEDAIDS